MSGGDAPVEASGDARGLAASLAPVIACECDGRLGEVAWFKADWQRGGAATGYATWSADGGDVGAVVKLPVVERELLWLERLQRDDGASVVPRLYAGGRSVGGYDLAWIVIERFEHGPLGLHWSDDHVPRIADAAARFAEAARSYPADGAVGRRESWPDLVKQAQQAVRINEIDGKQQWATALKALKGRLPSYTEAWRERPVTEWVHGDLHFANAMCRAGGDDAPVCLIDLAEVRAGHWLEDAVYLERQLWASPERLKATRPVKAMATARKSLGLPVDADYPQLAMVRRALLAGTAPSFLKSEGSPAFLAACLSWLERALAELK